MRRLVACRDVTTKEFASVNSEERLLQAKLEISSMLLQGGEKDLLEYVYQVTSPNRNLQVADYQPRTQPASDYAGNIGIETRKERSKSLGLAVNSAWDYLVRGSGSGEIGSKDSSAVRFELVAPQESVAASGTIARGHGVYFKLRRMRQSLLEGGKELVIVFRTPRAWRGDYLHVRCQASGVQRGLVRQFDEQITCGQAEFLVALYREGDETSKQVAERFVDAASVLQRAAEQSRLEIHKQIYPTPLHEFGALIGAVEPRMPETWLSELMDPRQEIRIAQITRQLPTQVRGAVHRYLAAREELRRLRG